MLEVSGVATGCLGENVISEINFSVGAGEVVAIVGSNGAGKSTLFRAVCGLLRPTAGTVRFDGEPIHGWPTHRISRAGLAFVPAERHLFAYMSVKENLALGAYPRRPRPADLDLVVELFPRLGERLAQRAGTMSGGEQQMLAVGRALMSRPRLLMLDEPTTGLAPKLADAAYRALATLRRSGLTLLVAEQQVPLVLRLADRGYVLENGRIQMEGSAHELEQDPDVRRAYLGVT